jgi:hypothetical protein
MLHDLSLPLALLFTLAAGFFLSAAVRRNGLDQAAGRGEISRFGKLSV